GPHDRARLLSDRRRWRSRSDARHPLRAARAGGAQHGAPDGCVAEAPAARPSLAVPIGRLVPDRHARPHWSRARPTRRGPDALAPSWVVLIRARSRLEERVEQTHVHSQRARTRLTPLRPRGRQEAGARCAVAHARPETTHLLRHARVAT